MENDVTININNDDIYEDEDEILMENGLASGNTDTMGFNQNIIISNDNETGNLLKIADEEEDNSMPVSLTLEKNEVNFDEFEAKNTLEIGEKGDENLSKNDENVNENGSEIDEKTNQNQPKGEQEVSENDDEETKYLSKKREKTEEKTIKNLEELIENNQKIIQNLNEINEYLDKNIRLDDPIGDVNLSNIIQNLTEKISRFEVETAVNSIKTFTEIYSKKAVEMKKSSENLENFNKELQKNFNAYQRIIDENKLQNTQKLA